MGKDGGWLPGRWIVVRIGRDLGYPFYRLGDGVDRGDGIGDVCGGLTRAGTRRPVEESLHRGYVEI